VQEGNGVVNKHPPNIQAQNQRAALLGRMQPTLGKQRHDVINGSYLREFNIHLIRLPNNDTLQNIEGAWKKIKESFGIIAGLVAIAVSFPPPGPRD
jgi:hypothetical protein